MYYLVPALLAVLIFASDFLSTDLFKEDLQNFAVWFVLSLFTFACGWLIDKTLGWRYGGKILFAVTVATVFVSVIMISLFNNYFGVNSLLTENLILYSLRNILLGTMGFFGMSVAEVIALQKELSSEKQMNKELKRKEDDVQRKAEMIINEAKLKAEKILLESETKARVSEERLNRIESRLKEFIQIEKELIKKYEQEENDLNLI